MDKYQLVDVILASSDLYDVLGIERDASTETIRRAYMHRSRLCHPDKFVPSYPRATDSFQSLVLAYETLRSPSTRLAYNHGGSKEEECFPGDMFERVACQLYEELFNGELHTLRTALFALSEANPRLRIGEDLVNQAERALHKMHGMLESSRTCYKVAKSEALHLYGLQQELRKLPYLHVWRRMQISIMICKGIIALPVALNSAQKGSLIAPMIEEALTRVISVLDIAERFTAAQ